jgi:ethanolamine ammonia-lyase small subunit
LAVVVADGLSALAVHQNAVPLIAALCKRLESDTHAPWRLPPVALVEQARVAVGDEVGQALGARAVVVLIGERPGLSSPDSMGIYLSWAPRVGLTDAQRNCISNVRPAGLSVEAAADKLHYLLRRARSLGLTGVELKDDSAPEALGLVAGSAPALGLGVWKG